MQRPRRPSYWSGYLGGVVVGILSLLDGIGGLIVGWRTRGDLVADVVSAAFGAVLLAASSYLGWLSWRRQNDG